MLAGRISRSQVIILIVGLIDSADQTPLSVDYLVCSFCCHPLHLSVLPEKVMEEFN